MSERGAHWKAAFDTYGIPVETVANLIGNSSGSKGTVSYTTTVGIPSGSLDDLSTVTMMVLFIQTDGMGSGNFEATQANSGEPATVTINYEMMG